MRTREPEVASHSSGDLLADRRFAYAEGLLADGDFIAAADLLRQVLERTPCWVPALMALGTAAERGGEREAAEAAFTAAAMHDPDGTFGASLHRGRLRDDRTAPDLPAAYVARLFDDYAPRFDEHLVGGLGYRGPAVIVEALAAADTTRHHGRALDLGCGTGLMGRAIRDAVGRLEGIDLSAAMVRRAAETGLYDALAVGTMADHLAERPAGSLDLVLAADVFVYCGALDPVLAAVGRVLRSGGVLAFTVQRGDKEPVRLGDDLRVSHSAAYLGQAIIDAGLDRLWLADASTRREAGRPVPGLVAVTCKP